MAKNKKIAYWAKNKKISDWANNNEKLLIHMYKNDFIDGDDIRVMNNRDGKYKIEAQNNAFNRIKKDIQSRYSEDKLNSDEAQKLDPEILKGYRDFRESADKFDIKSPLLSEKLIDQIDNSGIEHSVLDELKAQIKNMSDKDLKEFIDINSKSLDSNLGNAIINNIPDLKNYINEAPDYAVRTDFDKMFDTENVLDKFDELPVSKIAYVAEKNGMTTNELILRLQDAMITKGRDDIAHGRWNNVGVPRQSDNPKKGKFWSNMGDELAGTALTLLAPRTQEAISRGEDPSIKDYGLDLAENAIYAGPGKLLRLSKVGSKVGSKIGGKVGKSLSNSGLARVGAKGGSYFVAPTVTEVLDDIAYDEDKNSRGDFSVYDATFGGAINMATPFLFEKVGGLGKKFLGENLMGPVENLGKGKTVKEITEPIREQLVKDRKILATYGNPKGKKGKISEYLQREIPDEVERNRVENLLDAADTDLSKLRYGSKNDKNRELVFGVAESPGKTLREKIDYYDTNRPKSVKNPGTITKLSDKQDKFWKDSGLNETLSAKGAGQLNKELIFRDYLSNKVGDAAFDDSEFNLEMELPFVSQFSQYLKKQKAIEDKERAKKEAIESHQDRSKAVQDAIEKNKRAGRTQMKSVTNMLRPEMTVKRLYSNI